MFLHLTANMLQDMVVNACNPTLWKLDRGTAERGGSWGGGVVDTMRYLARLCLENTKQNTGRREGRKDLELNMCLWAC